MKKTLWKLFCVVMVGVLMAACAPGGNKKPENPSPTLPSPRVWITRLPPVPSATPDLALALDSTPTASVSEPIQAWPTADEEQYLMDQIDGLIGKIDRILSSTDTNIKP
jgi:hypothetical protein